MIVAFRNYFRNKMVNLTALSVKHFIPDAEFHCFTFYKHNPVAEYANQEPLYDWIKNTNHQTKWTASRTDVHDSPHIHGTSGAGHPHNGMFFAESFNLIHDTFKDVDDIVLCLCEDHFFTTGATLKEVVNEDYGLCIGPVAVSAEVAVYPGQDREANACIMAFRPKRIANHFPLPEGPDPIEILLRKYLVEPVLNEGTQHIHRLTTRNWTDYCGDGLYTNSSDVIREEMVKAGIL
jgi:hypothetical protein